MISPDFYLPPNPPEDPEVPHCPACLHSVVAHRPTGGCGVERIGGDVIHLCECTRTYISFFEAPAEETSEEQKHG